MRINRFIKKSTHFLLIAFFFISCKSFFETEPKENVFFIAEDRGVLDPSDDNTVYYRIYSNLKLYKKTPSGLFFEKKKVGVIIKPGRFLIRVERWELKNKENGLPAFHKANNVYQYSNSFYIDVKKGEWQTIYFGFDHSAKKPYKTIKKTER